MVDFGQGWFESRRGRCLGGGAVVTWAVRRGWETAGYSCDLPPFYLCAPRLWAQTKLQGLQSQALVL